MVFNPADLMKHKVFNVDPKTLAGLMFRKRLAHGIVGAGVGASAGLLADKALGTDYPWLSSVIGGLGGAGLSQALTNTSKMPGVINDAVDFQKRRHEFAIPMGPISQLYGTPSYNTWLHPGLGAIALGGTVGALNSDYGPLTGATIGGTMGGLMGMMANRGMLYGAKFPRVYTKFPEMKAAFNANNQ